MRNGLIAFATVGVFAAAPADVLGHGFGHHPSHHGHRGDVFGAAVLGGLLGGLIGSALAAPRYYAHEAPPRVVIERRYHVPYDPPRAHSYGGPSRYCYGPTRYYDHDNGEEGALPRLLGDYPRCED